MDLSQVALRCCQLARNAGSEILQYYGGPAAVVTKTDGSPLTKADEAAHRILVDGLTSAFPGVPVLSEEAPDDGSRRASERCFVVDPLDGTKEFLSRNGEFTVNIALIEGGVPVVGVVFAPALNDLYWAWSGGGAWRKSGDLPAARIQVGSVQTPPRLTVSRSHRSKEEDEFIVREGVNVVIPMGSSLKGCLVARGGADLYLRAGTVMEWDIAAMHAIVVEAGGCLVHWADRQKSVQYNQSDTLSVPGFVCASMRIP